MKKYLSSGNGLNDYRLFNAAAIINEFKKPPLNQMLKLRDNFIIGRYFGTIYRVDDGISNKYTIVIDCEKNAYTMGKMEYEYHELYLMNKMLNNKEFDKPNNILES